MSVRRKARRPSTRTRTKKCYHATLIQAINRHLPCGLFDTIHAKGKLRWCERYLALCVILMAWGISTTLADRFDEARACLTRMFPGRRRAGKTYRGLMAAITRASERLLAKVSCHLRGEVRAVAGPTHWQVHGFVPIGVDGSKVECPMTAANEQAFGCAGKRKSTPQQFMTTLLHLPSGIVWEFACGPACSSERQHLRDMLPTLPLGTLLIADADAGFTGYDLLATIMAGGKDFLIRVGSNVRLLTKLGFAVEERGGGQTVYLWPEGTCFRATHPPLVLRLITLIDGRNRRMHLLSSVLDETAMSDQTASEFYTMRWGLELYYRTLKQTMQRRKLCGDSPTTARIELRWAIVGLWLLCLMGAAAMIRSGKNPRRLSAAGVLRIIRDAMKSPTRRLGRAGVERALAEACIDDTCKRMSNKKARHWPHRKKPKPIGKPKARKATMKEVQLAQQFKQHRAAA